MAKRQNNRTNNQTTVAKTTEVDENQTVPADTADETTLDSEATEEEQTTTAADGTEDTTTEDTQTEEDESEPTEPEPVAEPDEEPVAVTKPDPVARMVLVQKDILKSAFEILNDLKAKPSDVNTAQLRIFSSIHTLIKMDSEYNSGIIEVFQYFVDSMVGEYKQGLSLSSVYRYIEQSKLGLVRSRVFTGVLNCLTIISMGGDLDKSIDFSKLEGNLLSGSNVARLKLLLAEVKVVDK